MAGPREYQVAGLVMVRYCERLSWWAVAALWWMSGLLLVRSAAGCRPSVVARWLGGLLVA